MDPRTPVLIGGGQFTWRGGFEDAPGPLASLQTAAERAAVNAGLQPTDLGELDAVGVVAFAVDAPGSESLAVPRMQNAPRTLARALGAEARTEIYTHTGGNSPQQLINVLAERIAAGEVDFALAAGSEFMGSLRKKLKAGYVLEGYGVDEADAPERIGDPRPGCSAQERAHGLHFPVNAYPLFENALRARDRRSHPEHMRRIGALFAGFTRVAAANPHAWFRQERTADELITVAPDNRLISFPYPKRLNAIMDVDQSAAVLMCSVERAQALGVPQERWVFLHGCADAADLWNPLDRRDYVSSPAIRAVGERALAMAGIGVEDLAVIDLYSCFPVAVEIAAEALGLSLDDPRGLTLTGGLPYFGGPGNNFSMHAVAEMLDRLRARPGAYGLVTANGWFLTKHSMGVYSTTPVDGPWVREDPAVLQREIDALPHPEIVERPEGQAWIETYTIVHNREGYRMGIVIGRDEQARRFVAHTPADPALLASMETREQVGRPGAVGLHPDGVRNLFIPGG